MTTALDPVLLDPIVLGEPVRTPENVAALAPRELIEVVGRVPVTLDQVKSLPPLDLAAIAALEPVPVHLLTDESGTVWWGGHGPPSTTLPGVQPGDYYVDYDTGDVWRLVADDFGEVA